MRKVIETAFNQTTAGRIKKKRLCVRIFNLKMEKGTKEKTFRTKIAKLWTINNRAQCLIKTDCKFLLLGFRRRDNFVSEQSTTLEQFSVPSSMMSFPTANLYKKIYNFLWVFFMK